MSGHNDNGGMIPTFCLLLLLLLFHFSLIGECIFCGTMQGTTVTEMSGYLLLLTDQMVLFI
jgi:hypothetical protein